MTASAAGKTTQIGFLNESVHVSDDDFKAITTLLQYQTFAHVAPALGLEPVPVTAYESKADIPVSDGTLVFTFTDQPPPEAGVLAFHTENPDGGKLGYIFTATLANAGAAPLLGQYSFLSTAGHEVIEALEDAPCNRWVDGLPTPKGSQWSFEFVDPVEAQIYRIDEMIDGTHFVGDATNFVLENFFDLLAVGQKTCYMGSKGLIEGLNGPFQIAEGGYAVVRESAGTESQIFGEVMPPSWRLAMKNHPLSRTYRRLHPGARP